MQCPHHKPWGHCRDPACVRRFAKGKWPSTSQKPPPPTTSTPIEQLNADAQLAQQLAKRLDEESMGPKRRKRLRLQSLSPEIAQKKKHQKCPCKCYLLDPSNNGIAIHYRTTAKPCLLHGKSPAEKKKMQRQIAERTGAMGEESRSVLSGTSAATVQGNMSSASAGPSNAPVVHEDSESHSEHESDSTPPSTPLSSQPSSPSPSSAASNPPHHPPETHSTTKCALHRIIRDQIGQVTHLTQINQFIQTVHLLAKHTTYCLEYYLCHKTSPQDFTILTKEHIYAIFQLLNKGQAYQPRTQHKIAIKEELWPYVEGYCTIFDFDHCNLPNDQQTAHYTGDSILTNLTVNVKEHFMQMYLRYINVRLDVQGTVQALKDLADGGNQLDIFYGRLRRFKQLATLEEDPEEDELDGLTTLESEVLTELWGIIPVQTECLQYSTVANPLAYLGSYCRLSTLYEQHGLRLFQAVPLRRSWVQSHVRIDTKILALSILGMRPSQMRGKWTVVRKRNLWNRVLRLNNKIFKHRRRLGLEFDFSISTDGHAASVHFKEPGLRYGYKKMRKSKQALRNELQQLYFQNHLDELRQAPNVVVIDPNKRDLLFCRDLNRQIPFRYTSMQRRFETKSNVIRKKREAKKAQAGVAQIESAIPTHKSMDVNNFAENLIDVQAATPTLQPFYSRPWHIQVRLLSYSLRQASEAKLIRNMRSKYGKHFSVVMGDWNDAGHTMRFQTSTKTVGFRKLFAQHHIPCFLLDEYRTSSRCIKCEGRLISGFRKRPSSRPWRGNDLETVYGLLGCPNLQCIEQSWTPQIVTVSGQPQPIVMKLYNRDVLSTRNMVKIVSSELAGNGRPLVFTR